MWLSTRSWKGLVWRWLAYAFLAGIHVAFIYQILSGQRERESFPKEAKEASDKTGPPSKLSTQHVQHRSRWEKVPQQHPVPVLTPLPSGRPAKFPKIQYDFPPEEIETSSVREVRRQVVRNGFLHTWKGYQDQAWMEDELCPVSGGFKNSTSTGGWGATLVDSLDTLWIMDLRDEFDEAVSEIATMDFSTSNSEKVSVFETTVTYLGGFLGAYELSGYTVLLDKAIEIGEMLYVAFDTPSRMPVARWKWEAASRGASQEPVEYTFIAELGSLSLEFTRLSQLTKDPKYFDAVQRIAERLDAEQERTKLRGMWPRVANTKKLSLTDDYIFSIGARANSLYDYLPKQHLLLGGLDDRYRKMYEGSADAIEKNLLFRPLNPFNLDVLLPGIGRATKKGLQLDPESDHQACFAGGMIAMGAKIFNRDDLDIARKLVEGCIWAYKSMPSGLMPHTFHLIDCKDNCKWTEQKWHEALLSFQQEVNNPLSDYLNNWRLQPGVTNNDDRRYMLSPEAIESLFILYRITGDTTLQDAAWTMFQAIESHTRTEFGYAILHDVTRPLGSRKLNDMPSYWPAATLKYFYLIFSQSELISLDDYVLNAHAHPFKRPKRQGLRSQWL